MLYTRENLIRKLSGRKDLYTVTRCVSAAEPLVKLQQEVQDCDAMMLYGLEEQKRNDLVKFCYEKSIRIYVAPEVSDILLRGADRVHSFDTPFFLLRNSGLSFEQRIMKRAMDILISSNLERLIYTIAGQDAEKDTELMNELKEKGENCSFDAIKEDIEKRDYQDMHREISPLKQADDAILLDTSNMNIEQVVAAMRDIIDKAIKNS